MGVYGIEGGSWSEAERGPSAAAKRLRNPLQNVPNEPARTILAPQCQRTFHYTSLEVAHCAYFAPFRFHEKRCGVPIRKRWCHRFRGCAACHTKLCHTKLLSVARRS